MRRRMRGGARRLRMAMIAALAAVPCAGLSAGGAGAVTYQTFYESGRAGDAGAAPYTVPAGTPDPAGNVDDPTYHASPLDLGTFGAGEGFHMLGTVAGGRDTFSYTFTVPHRIRLIGFEAADGKTIDDISFYLNLVLLDVSPPTPLVLAATVAPGTHEFRARYFGVYDLEFTPLAAVPAPAALPLSLGGIAALALLRRRRRG